MRPIAHRRRSLVASLRLPSLVELELRAAARRPSFYWLRLVFALVVSFQGYELLNRHNVAPPPGTGIVAAVAPGPPAAFFKVGTNYRLAPGVRLVTGTTAPAPPVPVAAITGAQLLHQMSWFLFPATLLLGLLAADSIARERREGTLGLLLLTELTPGEIVYGKMLACGLRSFVALLACVPALMIAVLAGGVTGTQSALTGIGLLNTLFVSLAAGIWMSTVFGERRHAIAATLGLVAALAFGPELLAVSWFGFGAVPYARLLGLGGWMAAAQFPLRPTYFLVCWLVPTQALGWAFLWRAAVTLAATWQDRPHKQFHEPETAEEWPIFTAAAAAAEEAVPAATTPAPALWPTNPRPWDTDPIQWRVERLGSFEGLIWLAVLLAFAAQFSTLGSIVAGGVAGAWGLPSFVGMTGVVFSGGLLAWAGARFFQDARRQQDFALLLTTPLGGRNILAGQWRVLRRALAWPLGVVPRSPSGVSPVSHRTHTVGSNLNLRCESGEIPVRLRRDSSGNG